MRKIVFKSKGFEISKAEYGNGFSLTYNGNYLATTHSRKEIDPKAWAEKKAKERIKTINARIEKLYQEIDSLSETLAAWEELPEAIREHTAKEFTNAKSTTETPKDP
jgi:hypothetical protein